MGVDAIRSAIVMQFRSFTAIVEAIGLLLEVAPTEEIERRLRNEVLVTQVSVALA